MYIYVCVAQFEHGGGGLSDFLVSSRTSALSGPYSPKRFLFSFAAE